MDKKLKETQINLRIDKQLLTKIRVYCRENGINLSQEIRLFLQSIIVEKGDNE